jgi:hypothetical protein
VPCLLLVKHLKHTRLHPPSPPLSQRTYSAARNFGATVDGKPLCVSKTKRVEDALVVSRELIISFSHGRLLPWLLL